MENLPDLLLQAFSAVNTTQMLIIAVIVALIMPKFSTIGFAAAGALAANLFVTIARHQIFDKSVEKTFSKLGEEFLKLDATVLISQFVGFILVISAFYWVKRLLLRDK